VQVVVALLANADGEQDTELTVIGGATPSAKVCEPPPRLAVRVAV